MSGAEYSNTPQEGAGYENITVNSIVPKTTQLIYLFILDYSIKGNCPPSENKCFFISFKCVFS